MKTESNSETASESKSYCLVLPKEYLMLTNIDWYWKAILAYIDNRAKIETWEVKACDVSAQLGISHRTVTEHFEIMEWAKVITFIKWKKSGYQIEKIFKADRNRIAIFATTFSKEMLKSFMEYKKANTRLRKKKQDSAKCYLKIAQCAVEDSAISDDKKDKDNKKDKKDKEDKKEDSKVLSTNTGSFIKNPLNNVTESNTYTSSSVCIVSPLVKSEALSLANSQSYLNNKHITSSMMVHTFQRSGTENQNVVANCSINNSPGKTLADQWEQFFKFDVPLPVKDVPPAPIVEEKDEYLERSQMAKQIMALSKCYDRL